MASQPRMTTDPIFPSITKVYHQSSYPAIDPTNPTLSTAGKSIIITGGGSGIGRAAALSFARSGIDSIALLGRREAQLKETADLIAKETPSVKVYAYPTDLSNRVALERAVTSFAEVIPSHKIDILLANAGINTDYVPLSAVSLDVFQQTISVNTLASVSLLQLAHPHLATNAIILHTSTGAAHSNMPGNGAYGISKLAGAMIFQQWAMENPDHFVLSFHPGVVATDMGAAATGLGEFDDVSLSADFAVWAASQKAKALGSGKFVWAHWDVDELEELGKKGAFQGFMTKVGLPVPSLGQIGLVGWPPVQA